MSLYKKVVAVGLLSATLVSTTSAFGDFAPISAKEVDLKTIEVEFSENLKKDAELSLKVIESWEYIAKVTRDYNHKNKALVELSNELEPNTNYILLGILGAAGNISFSLPSEFSDLELMNERVLNPDNQDIEMINVKSPSEVEVTFTSEIKEDISMKLIKNIDVVFSEIKTDKVASIILDKDLQSHTDYTIAVMSATSESWAKVYSAHSLLDFRTWDTSSFQIKQEEMVQVSEEDKPKDLMDMAHRDDNKLPDSGTKENIIILLALVIGLVIVFKDKLFKTV